MARLLLTVVFVRSTVYRSPSGSSGTTRDSDTWTPPKVGDSEGSLLVDLEMENMQKLKTQRFLFRKAQLSHTDRSIKSLDAGHFL